MVHITFEPRVLVCMSVFYRNIFNKFNSTTKRKLLLLTLIEVFLSFNLH